MYIHFQSYVNCTEYLNDGISRSIISGDIAFRYIEYLKNLKQGGYTSDSDFDINIPGTAGMEEQDDMLSPDKTEQSSSADRPSLITISDINEAMLNVGKKKAASMGYTSGNGRL